MFIASNIKNGSHSVRSAMYAGNISLLRSENLEIPKAINILLLTEQKAYLSISPNTTSSDPMIATTSATISPSAMTGSADRFTKLGPRK